MSENILEIIVKIEKIKTMIIIWTKTKTKTDIKKVGLLFDILYFGC